MPSWLRVGVFVVLVRPLLRFWIGFRVRGGDRLPKTGPAVILANHNSHLDTLALLSVLPIRSLGRVRPVGAEDYFCCGPLRRFFSLALLNMLAIERGKPDRAALRAGRDPTGAMAAALDAGAILVLFPEGTRGEPEAMSPLKRGVARLAAKRPNTPFTPVYLHGLGKALPKGEAVLVPFYCDVLVGEAIRWAGDRGAFIAEIERTFADLQEAGGFRAWR